MMVELKDAMKQSRSMVKEIVREKTNNFETGLFWEESLRSWIVIDNDISKKILTSSNFTANRKKIFFKRLNLTNIQKIVLEHFYLNWLMYMDGTEHIALRKKMQKPVNKIKKEVTGISKELSNEILQDLNGELNVVKEITKPFSNTCLSKIFGLSIDDYISILNISTEAVNFLWKADPTESEISKTIDSIIKTTNYIDNIISEKRYDDAGLFKLMLDSISEEKEFIVALVNMLIDGHEPFQSSLTNLIFYHIHNRERGFRELNSKDLIHESIRYEPPFSYCARECIKQSMIADKLISVGDRVMMILYISNNNDKSISNQDNLSCTHSKKDSLSFGYGVHRCLGANITTLSLEGFLESFKKNDEHNNWQIKDYNHQTTYGFIEFKSLYIAPNNRYKV